VGGDGNDLALPEPFQDHWDLVQQGLEQEPSDRRGQHTGQKHWIRPRQEGPDQQ